jgi:hypothetical protein
MSTSQNKLFSSLYVIWLPLVVFRVDVCPPSRTNGILYNKYKYYKWFIY